MCGGLLSVRCIFEIAWNKMAEPNRLCRIIINYIKHKNDRKNSRFGTPIYSSKTDSLRHLPTRIQRSLRSSVSRRSLPVLLSTPTTKSFLLFFFRLSWSPRRSTGDRLCHASIFRSLFTICSLNSGRHLPNPFQAEYYAIDLIGKIWRYVNGKCSRLN